MAKIDHESLGARMKHYETLCEPLPILPERAIVVRLDGHCFSKLTQSLPKPFDPRFSRCMIRVATELLKRWHPATAYTHSDEITLIFAPNTTRGYVHPFGGRVTKLCSVLASECGILFCQFAKQLSLPDLIWAFDARLMAFDDTQLHEVANHMIFRQRDCKRNAVSTMARVKFGSKAILHKNTSELMTMMQLEFQETHDLCGTFIKKTQQEDLTTQKEPECRCMIVKREQRSLQKGEAPDRQDILFAKYWPSVVETTSIEIKK